MSIHVQEPIYIYDRVGGSYYSSSLELINLGGGAGPAVFLAATPPPCNVYVKGSISQNHKVIQSYLSSASFNKGNWIINPPTRFIYTGETLLTNISKQIKAWHTKNINMHIYLLTNNNFHVDTNLCVNC